MSTYAPKTIQAGFVGSSNTTMLDNGNGKKFRASSIDLYNIHTSAVTVAIWRAPADGSSVRTVSANDQYQRANLVVLAGNSVGVPIDWVLDTYHDSIQMKADVADKVSVVITGVEESA